ncbi:IucA/IucC family C-terminal-domain containing protein [Lysinibacillus telephonicus]|uniref:(2Fe-2S)-binding protein n=1 Tax=Lysinibacillus telephonicus TaxID=1714840 RepID=UPI0016398B38|nr:(2Fe-2S)-binding protein [Lysinibacillus telephonicus]
MYPFTPNELKVLEDKYRLTFQTNSSPLSVQVSHLINDNQAHIYLTTVKEKTKSANLGVAASLFVKRYSFAVLIALYSMSAFNKRINFSIDNLSVETLDESDILWLPSIKFNDINLSPASQENRARWRSEILKEIFANHIEVLFKQLSSVSKLSKIIMWENLYIYIVWMYKNLLADQLYSKSHHNIKEDFDMITAYGESILFGDYKENPFVKFRGTNDCQSILGETVYNRKTCCLSYLTENKGYFCKNCPIKRKQSN